MTIMWCWRRQRSEDDYESQRLAALQRLRRALLFIEQARDQFTERVRGGMERYAARQRDDDVLFIEDDLASLRREIKRHVVMRKRHQRWRDRLANDIEQLEQQPLAVETHEALGAVARMPLPDIEALQQRMDEEMTADIEDEEDDALFLDMLHSLPQLDSVICLKTEVTTPLRTLPQPSYT